MAKSILFQWLLSFLYPVIFKKIQSDVNSVLETTLENGKLVLNAANANYSYGSLYRVFIKALLRFNINIKNKKNFSSWYGWSVKKKFCQNNSQAQLDAVEIDLKIINIAKEMFWSHPQID